MVRKITINDKESFNYYGSKLNKNFEKLFNLEELLTDKFNILYCYEIESKVVGFIHMTKSFEEADLVNIIIDENCQNKGFGKELLETTSKENDIKIINLEVRESNENAIKFYSNLGFENIRTIKNYYENENAIFMKRVIK